jgi:hypothetical protein
MKTRLIVAVLTVLCCIVWAAEDVVGSRETGVRVQNPTAAGREGAAGDGSYAITIPRLLSYQGRLTDTAARAVRDSTYMVTFSLFAEASGGSPFWSENQTIETRGGLFSVLLGGVSPVPNLPGDGNCWLEMQVDPDPPLSPRIRIVSAAYAYKADTAGFALAGGDNAWRRLGNDSVLETVHNLGISRGDAGNALYGSLVHSHVNLGSASTTGNNQYDSEFCTVGGGGDNTASDRGATVGGGAGNTASSWFTTIAGGESNIASGSRSTVGGGAYNNASGSHATIGGGWANVASGLQSVIPGGREDTIRSGGNFSFAAGRHAVVLHSGCFVWGDGTGGRVATGGQNEWRARTSGGVWFYTNTSHTTGAYMGPSQNGWTNICDRANKEHFKPIDKAALLERLARMPVTEYRVKGQDPEVRHIGPVAQDFHAAFGCGETELGINSVDADGVLMAAVQALHEQNQAMRRRLDVLEARLVERE